jgi:hypothetical protein
MRGKKGGSLQTIIAMLFLTLEALARKGIFIFPILKDLKKVMLLDRLISYIVRSQTNNKKGKQDEE